MTTRAALYARISSDRTGEGLGVERQQQDCQQLVTEQGWTAVGSFVDNDLSAYSGKPRPGYLQLLELIAAGVCDAVVACHPVRLHRSPAELEEFIALLDRHHVTVRTVQAGHWDLSTPSGRLVARQLGAVARYESDHKSERIRRKLEANAVAGTPHGRLAYGWTRIEHPRDPHRKVDVVNPEQAAVVQAIADRIIGGDSLRQIAADLNAAGTPPPSGTAWTKNKVRDLARRPSNAGFRVHHGEVVGPGTWERLLEPGVFDQVQAVLDDPARRTSQSSTGRHLLSGLARCGVCGAGLRVGLNSSSPTYRCQARACVARKVADLDELVELLVVGRLSRPDATDLLAPQHADERAAARAEADTLRARLDLAADAFAAGELDRQQLVRITGRLRPQLEEAERRARAVDDVPLLTGLVGGGDVQDAWDALPLSRKRAVIDLLLIVTVNRTQQGARRFRPEDVDIEWRGHA